MRKLPREYRSTPFFQFSVYGFLITTGLLTAASAAAIVDEPAWAVPGLLFFGFGFVIGELNRRERLDAKTRDRIEPFQRRLRRRDTDGYGWLLRVLARIDGRTPRARRRSRVALEAIAADKRLMDGLIVHSRQRRISVAVFAARLGRTGAGALVPSLASLHSDGRVRQAAVTSMNLRWQPACLPFLLERTVDWVPEVRAAAQDALRAQLRSRPDLLPAARSAYTRIALRKHAPEVGLLLESL